MRRRLPLVATSCAVVLVAGCSSSGSHSALSAAGAASLQSDVLALTRGAAAHNWPAADSALSELRSDLAAARAAGSVSVARAAKIEATMTAITADLAAQRGTPTSSTAAHSSPSEAPTTTRAASSTAPKSLAPKPAPVGRGDKGHGKKHKG